MQTITCRTSPMLRILYRSAERPWVFREFSSAKADVIRSGILLERYPTLTRDPAPEESEYWAMKQAYDAEKERLIEEKREENWKKYQGMGRSKKERKALKLSEKMKQRKKQSDEEDIERLRLKEDQERKEKEEMAVEEEKLRVSEADRRNDVKSLERRRDVRLYLLVKYGENGVWGFPSVPLRPEDTLRKAAERASSLCGKTLKTYFYGNAPDAHDDKTFFYRCLYLEGDVVLRRLRRKQRSGEETATNQQQLEEAEIPMVDYVWAARDELGKYIVDENAKTLAVRMTLT